ncbi:MAG TPA: hypothetical protein VIS57_02185 [Xanthomonadales bacterium]
MNRQEIVALKLQMGIDPSAKILPNVLLAMWQQLKIESGQALRNRPGAILSPDQMTSTPIDV